MLARSPRVPGCGSPRRRSRCDAGPVRARCSRARTCGSRSKRARRRACPAPSLTVTERIARIGERETPLQRVGRRVPRHVCARASPARPLRRRGGARDDRRPVRARARGGRARGGRLAARLPAPRRARPALLRERRQRAGRAPAAAAPADAASISTRVREYEEGESLRKVHWPTTARRGQLMVKELEDAPRDEIAVLLDADAKAPSTGESFDVQVRAAGSILRAHASHGRRAVLAVNSARRPTARVSSLDGDWLAALALLAEVEPDGHAPARRAAGAGERPGLARARDRASSPPGFRAHWRRSSSQRSLTGHGVQRGLDRRAELRRAPDEGRARRSCACRPPASRSPSCGAETRSRRSSAPRRR